MNKHIKTALFIAPILALGAYFAADVWVSKQTGDSQNLRQVGQCVPKENACLFRHADFEIKMISQKKNNQLQLALVSNRPIEKISLALSKSNVAFNPFPLGMGDNRQYWQILLKEGEDISQYKHFRLALEKDDKSLFSEGAWVL